MSHVDTWGKGTSAEGTINIPPSTPAIAILQGCAEADPGPWPIFSLARERIRNKKRVLSQYLFPIMDLWRL